MDGDDRVSEQVRDVYAHFGLAIYLAQVLDHGIVNALVVSQHIPNNLKSFKSQEEWESAVDAFMDGLFASKTLGRLIGALKSAITLPEELGKLLSDALKTRNWLAHHYFRERVLEFMSSSGRDQMIEELVGAQKLLSSADKELDQLVRSLREQYGMTEEAIAASCAEMFASASR